METETFEPALSDRRGRARLWAVGSLATGVAMLVGAAASLGFAPGATADEPPLLCGTSVVTLRGTEAGDVLRGTDGDDVIAGLGGNDIVEGFGGNDVIC